MKKIILMFLSFVAFNSCNSQGKIDLEKVDFTKNYKEILKDTKSQTDAREIVTTLPIAYTKEVGGYKFGDVSLINSSDASMKSSTVGVLINNSKDRTTVGIKIEIEDTSTSVKILTHLKEKYKNPKILSKIPEKNSDGQILGNSAYLWQENSKTIVLVQYYEYTDKKPNTSSVLYIVDNKVNSEGLSGTVASHLIKTFTP